MSSKTHVHIRLFVNLIYLEVFFQSFICVQDTFVIVMNFIKQVWFYK